jgi:hypothetical protein
MIQNPIPIVSGFSSNISCAHSFRCLYIFTHIYNNTFVNVCKGVNFCKIWACIR